MRSDLILMIFDRQVDTQRVYDAIQSMRHSQILGLDSAIIVTRNHAGEISLFQKRVVSGGQKAKNADVLGEIAELFFAPDSEERRTALVKLGLDERFVARIFREMDVDKSALCALLSYDDIADRDELVGTMALFRGQIYQSTISTEGRNPIPQTDE